MQTDFEKAHFPKTRAVSIGGHEYIVRPLGLRQLFQIGAFAGSLPAIVRERIVAKADSGASEVMSILTCLEDSDAAQLFAILLRANSPEDMRRFAEADLLEASEVALAFTEVNDLEKLVANFRKAAENARGLLTMTPSLPSSQK